MNKVAIAIVAFLLTSLFWYELGYLEIPGITSEKEVLTENDSTEANDYQTLSHQAEHPELDRQIAKLEEQVSELQDIVKQLEKIGSKQQGGSTSTTKETSSPAVEPTHPKVASNPQTESVQEPEQQSNDIIGKWVPADPVGWEEGNKMLLFNEYGVFKDYSNKELGSAKEYTYTISGNTLKYKDKYESSYKKSFKFKVSTINGKKTLEIYGNAELGGKYVSAK